MPAADRTSSRAAAYDLLVRGHEIGEQPWSRLYAEGHANHWRPAADYVTQYHNTWTAALLDAE